MASGRRSPVPGKEGEAVAQAQLFGGVVLLVVRGDVRLQGSESPACGGWLACSVSSPCAAFCLSGLSCPGRP